MTAYLPDSLLDLPAELWTLKDSPTPEQTHSKAQCQKKYIPMNVSSNDLDGNSRSNVSIRLSGTCAINLYGLPRAFSKLVLPSLIQNVISVNPTCDYYMHFYNQTSEDKSRAGSGGTLDSPEIIMELFTQAVHQVNPHARVQFRIDTNETVVAQRKDILDRLLNDSITIPGTKPSKLLYRRDRKSHKVEAANLVRMWHSQEGVWNLMKQQQQQQQQPAREDATTSNQTSPRHYDYVAMLRNDVFYMNPIDILDVTPFGPALAELSCNMVIFPGFARFPKSDRMIYGPYRAVEPWATGRFDHLEEAVLLAHAMDDPKPPDPILRSEAFVENMIVPQIHQRGFFIAEHPTACFLRARADDTLWMSDCFQGALPSVFQNVTGLGKDLTFTSSNTNSSNTSTYVFQFTNANDTAYQRTKTTAEAIIGTPCPHMRTNKWLGIWPMVLYCGNSTPPLDPKDVKKKNRTFFYPAKRKPKVLPRASHNQAFIDQEGNRFRRLPPPKKQMDGFSQSERPVPSSALLPWKVPDFFSKA